MCATNFLVISRPVNVCIRTDSLEYEKLIQEPSTEESLRKNMLIYSLLKLSLILQIY